MTGKLFFNFSSNPNSRTLFLRLVLLGLSLLATSSLHAQIHIEGGAKIIIIDELETKKSTNAEELKPIVAKEKSTAPKVEKFDKQLKENKRVTALKSVKKYTPTIYINSGTPESFFTSDRNQKDTSLLPPTLNIPKDFLKIDYQFSFFTSLEEQMVEISTSFIKTTKWASELQARPPPSLKLLHSII